MPGRFESAMFGMAACIHLAALASLAYLLYHLPTP